MTYKTVNSNYCQLPILNIDANNITSMTNNMHESRASYRPLWAEFGCFRISNQGGLNWKTVTNPEPNSLNFSAESKISGQVSSESRLPSGCTSSTTLQGGALGGRVRKLKLHQVGSDL